ncbi:flagellar protein FlaG [Cohnella xylanilytica]|uniref:Flagellar protein FlaG n=2 Tax=Cohnella xylanilytica TaxID=557555 RepID=A0A841TX54_9BACL|nr:flagellar protein FlaG [Cohnella xylanilytica]
MGSQVAGASVQPQIAPIRSGGKEGADAVNLQPTLPRLRSQEENGAGLSIGEEQLYRAIERAVKAMQGPETSIQMHVHEKTHAVVIKVFNKETGDLIREVPPEKTLDLVAKMMEFAGILIDEKV